MAGEGDAEKLDITDSWTTDWKAIKLKFHEFFGDDLGLVPELAWTQLFLDVRSGTNGLEHEMTPDLLPPHGLNPVWVPESHFYEWLYAKQENILNKQLTKLRLDVSKQQNFIEATQQERTKVLNTRATDGGDRERKTLRLQMLVGERSKLGKSRESLTDDPDIRTWDELTDLIDPLEAEVEVIDNRNISPSRFDEKDGDKVITDWYPDADHLNDNGSLTRVNLDEAIKAAELKRNIIKKTQIAPLQNQLIISIAAKEYWQAKADDYRKAHDE